jgi:hypothetical protein
MNSPSNGSRNRLLAVLSHADRDLLISVARVGREIDKNAKHKSLNKWQWQPPPAGDISSLSTPLSERESISGCYPAPNVIFGARGRHCEGRPMVSRQATALEQCPALPRDGDRVRRRTACLEPPGQHGQHDRSVVAVRVGAKAEASDAYIVRRRPRCRRTPHGLQDGQDVRVHVAGRGGCRRGGVVSLMRGASRFQRQERLEPLRQNVSCATSHVNSSPAFSVSLVFSAPGGIVSSVALSACIAAALL